MKRISERDHISTDEALKKMKKVDTERAQFYNSFSETEWADAESYDLVVDTDCLGIQGAKKVIIASLSEINR